MGNLCPNNCCCQQYALLQLYKIHHGESDDVDNSILGCLTISNVKKNPENILSFQTYENYKLIACSKKN